MEELEVTKEQVSIFFPQDLLSTGLGKEIIIFVDGLFENPKRTDEVRKKLAMNLAEEAHQSFPKAKLIECIIKPFNPQRGFCSGRTQKEDSFWGEFR